MRSAIWAFLILVVIAIGGFILFRGDDITISDYLPKQFTAYEFPRADMGPGTVFVGKIDGDDITIEKVICDNLYLATELVRETAAIALPNVDGSSGQSSSGVSQFIGGTFGSKFSAAREKVFSVKWGNVYISKLGSEKAYLEDGSERNITAACNERIDQFKHLIEEARDDEKIYVIVSTIASDDLILTYSTSGEFTAEGQLELPIAEGSQARQDAVVNLVESERAEITFEQTMFLGYEAPWEIVEWLPSSLTGSALASVRARPVEF